MRKGIGLGIIILLLAALILPALGLAYVGQGGSGDTMGYWRMNDMGMICTDSSGRGNDGSLNDNASWVSGKFGNAISLDGDGDYVDCGNVIDVNNKLTVEAWIKDSGSSSGNVVGKWESATKRWHIYIISGGLIYWNIGGSTFGTSSASVLGTDWHHVAMVYDGTLTGNANRLKAFVDGHQVSLTYTGTIPATMPGIAANLNIGRHATANFFNGLIDEVRVLNYPKTAFGGGVVVNEVYFGAGDNWIELYNNSDAAIDIKGWVFYDDTGGIIVDLRDISLSIGSGQWHTLTASTYPELSNLDSQDFIRVYDLDPDNDDTEENGVAYQSMVDFVAWGSSPEAGDADAVSAGIWTDNTFVTVGGNDTVHLKVDGNNDEAVSDWAATTGGTPGQPVPDVPALIFFGIGLALMGISYLIWRRRGRQEEIVAS